MNLSEASQAAPVSLYDAARRGGSCGTNFLDERLNSEHGLDDTILKLEGRGRVAVALPMLAFVISRTCKTKVSQRVCAFFSSHFTEHQAVDALDVQITK